MSTAVEDNGDTISILVVDDRAENVSALRAILERPDQEVVGVYSGEDALLQLLRREFAVILLDVLMPGMDGFETARMIRDRDRSRSTPIIFLTANAADVHLIYRGYSMGAVDYLIKPVDADIVRAKVRVFSELAKKNRALRRQGEKLRMTERELAKRQLEDREAEYEATFEGAPTGIARATLDGHWSRVNMSFCQILGRTREELVGRPVREVGLPGQRSDTSFWAPLLDGKLGSSRAEGWLIRPDGVKVYVNLTQSTLKRGDGSPRELIVVVEDVTEHRRGEEARRFLTEASQILLSSFEYESNLVLVERLATPSFADGFVIDVASDLNGPTPARGFTRESTAELLRHRGLRIAIEHDPTLTGLIITDPEVLEDVEGRSALIVPMRARGRTLGFMTAVCTERRFDEADLRTAEDLAHRVAFAIENAILYREAQKAVLARDEFLSVASHELRTPLTPLQIQLQRMLKSAGSEAFPPPRFESMLQSSERQVRRLTTLVDHLLDVSRISAGRLIISREQVDLSELVQELSNRFSDELARAGCALELAVAKEVTGQWDPMRIEQVLANLLANAAKYASGSPVSVTVEDGEGLARVIVRDKGMGIPKEKLQQIFGRFERAVTVRSHGGLGLGLYISKEIVEAHGGSIRVESDLGAGAAFIVELPKKTPLLLDEPSAAGQENRVVS